MRTIKPIEERFWPKVDMDGPTPAGFDTPCWLWTAATRKGYGAFSITRSDIREAHRIAYELVVGPIPPGLDLDHLCRNPPCVNPDHLEPVTHRVNCLRGTGVSARNAVKTHCVNGHAFTVANTYEHEGARHCRTCRREALQAFYQRKAIAA